MNRNNCIDRLIFIFVGFGILLSCLVLMGAKTETSIGRYQLEVVIRNRFPDLYVIDTATGRVKWVDFKNENKPFEAIEQKE